jgi:hypothetical protein
MEFLRMNGITSRILSDMWSDRAGGHVFLVGEGDYYLNDLEITL